MRGIVLLGFDIDRLPGKRPIDAKKALQEKLTQCKAHWKPKVRSARGSKDEGHDCIEVEYTIPGPDVLRIGCCVLAPTAMREIESAIEAWQPRLMYLEVDGVRSE